MTSNPPPLCSTLRRAVALTLTLALTLAATLPALAEFPDHPLKIIVPYPPGGTTDLLARAIAPRRASASACARP